MNFADKLKYYRKKRDFTQSSLGQKLNVSRKTISSWENSRTYPDIQSLLNISDELNVSVDYLIRNDDIVLSIDSQLGKSLKIKKYFNILFYLDIFLLFLGYFEMFNFMNFHMPIFLNLSILFCIITSFILLNINKGKLIKRFYFIIISLLSIIINLSFSIKKDAIIDILKFQNEHYLIGFLVGKFLLTLLLTILLISVINIYIQKKAL